MARLLSTIRHLVRRRVNQSWLHPAIAVCTALVLIAGWYTVFGDQGVATLRSLRAQLHQREREEGQLREQIRQLELELARLKDPEYLEQVIRAELGYVKPGEHIYQFMKPQEAANIPHTTGTPALAGSLPASAPPAPQRAKPAKAKQKKQQKSSND